MFYKEINAQAIETGFDFTIRSVVCRVPLEHIEHLLCVELVNYTEIPRSGLTKQDDLVDRQTRTPKNTVVMQGDQFLNIVQLEIQTAKSSYKFRFHKVHSYNSLC